GREEKEPTAFGDADESIDVPLAELGAQRDREREPPLRIQRQLRSELLVLHDTPERGPWSGADLPDTIGLPSSSTVIHFDPLCNVIGPLFHNGAQNQPGIDGFLVGKPDGGMP